MKILPLFALLLVTLEASPAATMRREISQYGITWTFDREYPAGQFVTGDWWVVGPVKVVAVQPPPGPVEAHGGEFKSRYGASAVVDDTRMRNGSMIVLRPDKDQGFDSRLKNYNPELSVSFPLDLGVNRSLISTISNETLPVPVLHEALMWTSEKQSALVLKSAAVLTCLAEEPPKDAFRPPYAGTEKPIFEASKLRWDRLPSLKPVGNVPSWEQFERYFARPWLDHQESWLLQHTGPSENQVNYGREFSRLTSMASLMLMLDVPRERKEKLLIGLVQFGIDLHGLAETGRKWSADGGHWNGRKWPILFAGLMLDDPRLAKLPEGVVFSEDQQMYYGTGWCGQTALYQIVYHTGAKPPHEEKAPETWDKVDKLGEGYRITVSSGLPGTALAVQLMGAKALWNHDAFFDYYDRWMSADDPYAAKRNGIPRPKEEGRSLDPFVNAMWTAYRDKVPVQGGGKDNLRWVWQDGGRQGGFVPNPKGESAGR
ncbi:hypothetical protein [Terrimicrobium sacchariphilum]|nr:hypothetical protein [Terrimicrobium sacchariphilum]